MSRRKKKASTAGRTHAVLIIDESGSMNARWEETIDGFNEIISGLRRDAEGEVLVTLTKFSTQADTVFSVKPLAEVEDLTKESYRPGGSTALLDAVGGAIRAIEPQVRKDDKVNVTIMTDGMENSSREYSKDAVVALLNKKREDGWAVGYLGASEASWAGAQALGIQADHAIFYGVDAHDHKAGMGAVISSVTATTRGAGAQGASYLRSAPALKAQLEEKAQSKEEDAQVFRSAARRLRTKS